MQKLGEKVKNLSMHASSQVELPDSFHKDTVTHAETNNAASWKDALANATTPSSYLHTKTLVFKPKVAKTETAVMILVVALDDTATSASQIAKAAGAKEARFATPDTVRESLGVTVEQGIFFIYPRSNLKSLPSAYQRRIARKYRLF
jgi:prolyl-tRNA editing enzyme YbaK/EbsC (Cys-tRNA(Pro) deacylase)